LFRRIVADPAASRLDDRRIDGIIEMESSRQIRGLRSIEHRRHAVE